MATRAWDRVPVYGWYYKSPDVPDTAGKVSFKITGAPTGVKRVDGRGIYRAGATLTVQVGNTEQHDVIIRETVRQALRDRDQAAQGASFDGPQWDADWTAALPAMVCTSFYAQDDTDITPQGWQIEVQESLTQGGKTYPIALTLSMLSTTIPGLNLADVEVPPGSPTNPAPVYAKGQPGGIASLDAAGLVPVAQLPAGLGGGVSDYNDLTNKPASFPTTTAQVTDALAVGRDLLKASSPTAARTVIGAGTSNLQLGVGPTTAKAGDWVPAWSDVTSKPTTYPPTTGTTSTTAAAGNDPRLSDARDTTAARITDASTVGRSVVTAADAAAARNAIGAGTSNLAIGTTSTTAAAGNDSRLSDARAPLAHSAGLITSGTLDAARLNTFQRIAFVDYSAGAAPSMPAGTLWIVTGAPADDSPVPSWVPAPALLFRSGS